LAAIGRSAESQMKLIDDLLDVTRIATGKLSIDPRPMEIGSAVSQAVQSIRPAAEEKGVRLSLNLAGLGNTVVRADPPRLHQVFLNLLSNSVKFTPAGGSINVVLRQSGALIEVEVADTGKGIPSDFLPHLFTRFRQADTTTSRTYGGLGLGLAIVKQLVELHRGTVQADSGGEGKGAKFTVRLPVAPKAVAEPGQGKSAGAAADDAPAVRLDGVRVLVVEDEPDARRAIEIFLRDAGANVVSAASADEALQRVKSDPVHVLLTDLSMPGKDGYALLRQVRDLEMSDAVPPIPAVALTALATPADRDRAIAAGFDEHVAKPVDPARLLSILRRLADR
jgi:CheY-like chemotaxis protein